MVRPYRPRPDILNGTWKFPEAQPVNHVVLREADVCFRHFADIEAARLNVRFRAPFGHRRMAR